MQKKRIMISALALVVVALVASWGVNAYFSDVESVGGNSVTAGTLDLEVGENAAVAMSVVNVYPGWGVAGWTTTEGPVDTYTYAVENAGTINGVLKMTVLNVFNSGVTTTEPETSAGVDNGELGGVLWMSVYYNDVHVYSGFVNDWGTVGEVELGDLAKAGTGTVKFDFEIAGTVGNEIQADLVSFNVQFDLYQDQGNEL